MRPIVVVLSPFPLAPHPITIVLRLLLSLTRASYPITTELYREVIGELLQSKIAELFPMTTLPVPEVIEQRELHPIATFLLPVWFAYKALCPSALLEVPALLDFKASDPTAVLWYPVL